MDDWTIGRFGGLAKFVANGLESVGFASFWLCEDLDILFDPGRGRIFVVEVSSLERFDAYGIMFFSDAVRTSFVGH